MKKLLILGCSKNKQDSDGPLLALDRYNGSYYEVLRKFLRKHQWPADVSIAVLSAKHGLFGILKGIENYDERMTANAARAKADECRAIIGRWLPDHESVHLSLGRDYMPAVQPGLESLGIETDIFEGGIGVKKGRVKKFLESTSAPLRRPTVNLEGGSGVRNYFLPDWDDLLDVRFDFEKDRFSGPNRAAREDTHCSKLMGSDHRMSDGILVSLAQQGGQKGRLRKLEGTEKGALSPLPLRAHFGLGEDQYLFGDCGAFSYANEDEPTISVEQAVALYDRYDFDFGASVDHIPLPKITRNGQVVELSDDQRQERVALTRANAERFYHAARHHLRKARFNPVGVIQGLNPEQYAQSVRDYHDIGYRHIAIGGLVPLPDKAVTDIINAVMGAANELTPRPWIHLFGIFRPKLQELFRSLKVDSFDSASYFRKAWLRSNQNYLAKNGDWYAALRVPMTSDGRTRRRLQGLDVDMAQLEREERRVLGHPLRIRPRRGRN